MIYKPRVDQQTILVVATKMSRVQHIRPSRKSSDFSIAKILADNASKSAASQTGNFIASHTTTSEEIVSRLDDCSSDPSPCHQHGNVVIDDNAKSSIRILPEFVDRSIVHSPSTSGLFQVDDEEKKSDKSSFYTEDCSTSDLVSTSDLYWLQCTRYRPPRIPRKSFAGKICRRRPATHPRIPFTSLQLEVLEEKYRRDAYLSRKDVIQLSTTLRLPHSRIKIWFQNRRARHRRETKVTSSSAVSQDRL